MKALWDLATSWCLPRAHATLLCAVACPFASAGAFKGTYENYMTYPVGLGGVRVVAAWVVPILCLMLAGCLEVPPGLGPEDDQVSLDPFLEGVPRLTGLTWVQAEKMSTAVHDAACTVFQGDIWAIGGIDSRRLPSANVQVYDPDSASWRAEVYVPTLRSSGLHGAAAVPIDDSTLHVIGGYESIGRTQPSDTVYERRAIGFWTETSRLPHRLAEAAPVSFGGVPMLWGGTKDGKSGHDGILRYTDSIDGWSSFTTMPAPRADAAMHFVGRDALYILGGWTSDPATPLEDATAYEFDSDQNEALPPLPVARTGSADALWQDRIVLAGGLYDRNPTAEVLVFDLKTRTWWQAPELPQRTAYACAVALADGVHVFGGTREDGRGAVDMHWVLQPVQPAKSAGPSASLPT